MRVLHVQKCKGIGGSERHLVELLAAQTRQGLDVRMCILATGDARRFESALADAGIATSSIPAGPAISPLVLARLAAEMRRFKPDLVHTHLIHADVQGQSVARALRVPAVSTIHGPKSFYRRHPTKAAGQLAARLARRTIVISHYLGRFVVELGLVPPDRVRVVPYGVDVSRWEMAEEERLSVRSDLGLRPTDVAVGIASRLIPGKGHESLIEAVTLARQEAPNLVLLIAGDGERREALERLAEPAGDGVRFVGYLSDVRPFLHASDVLVVPTQPSLGEGFGLVALEAMACARPVVVTDTASLPEVVEHEKTGIVVPPADVPALAGALRRLEDAALRKRLGEAGRVRAKTSFSLDAMELRTREVYREVLTATETASTSCL